MFRESPEKDSSEPLLRDSQRELFKEEKKTLKSEMSIVNPNGYPEVTPSTMSVLYAASLAIADLGMGN